MTTVYSIPVADIRPHPHNPRTDLGDLTELADSIRSQGVLQPITIVPDPGNPTGYMCLLGHRRHAAAALADQHMVPAIIRDDLSESQQILAMGVENVQRSDLTPVEEATWLQGLLDLGEVKRSQLSKMTGMAKSTVSSRLKLAHLPAAAKAKVHEGQATLEEALQLADADLPADVVEDLTTRLGTPSFRWEMEHQLRAAKAAADRAKARAVLEAAGVNWSDNNDGVDTTLWGFLRRVDVTVTPEDLTDLPGLCMAVPGHWGSEVNIYRPLTPDETATALAEIEERNRMLEARKSEPTWEERQEARRALLEPMNVARALRVEFLTPYTTGAKLLTPGQSTAVFDELVFGLGPLGWEVDDQLGWLDHNVYTPTTLGQKHTLGLAPEGRDRLALAALAACAEGAPDEELAELYDRAGPFTAMKTEKGWGASEDDRLSMGLPDLTEDERRGR